MARPVSHNTSQPSYPLIQDPLPHSSARCIEPIYCACSLIRSLAKAIADCVAAVFHCIAHFFTASASSTTPTETISPPVNHRAQGREFLYVLFRKHGYTLETLQIRQTTDNTELLEDLGRRLVYDLIMDSPQNPEPLPFFARGRIIAKSRETFDNQIENLRHSFNELEEPDRADVKNQFIDDKDNDSPCNYRMVTFLRKTNMLAHRFRYHQDFVNCVNEAIASFTA